MRNLIALALLVVPFAFASPPAGGGLTKALEDAGRALDAGDLPRTREALDRVLERDSNSLVGWGLVERWAEKAGERDERVYALHKLLALTRTQTKDKAAVEALRARLLPLDPVANQLGKLRTDYVDKLVKLAEGYEKGRRPHSAIRAYKQALALDPDRADLQALIERLAASPDPSLAEDARPKDLLEGISAEWIAAHDKKHLEWSDKAVLEKPNYVTQTDAGYEVLVRTGEAMEQMNAFYRIFFRYGAEGDKRNPSRIFVNIYKTRSEYTQDPKDWSGGHFTGDSVETYIGSGGFEEMTGTLFHEAAHQFVSLATNAAGWLNEGLASFFEGTRILSNGTVIMNLPATGRLYALIPRMERGFMEDVKDGIDPDDVTKDPPKSPTFRIVLEDRYEWGPPWYAPTWGVVFFLYNYQDPVDGRFVYRKTFWDFVDASGGLSGDSAIQKFEELVLANPAPPTTGVQSTMALPKTVDQLNEVWMDYILGLGQRQNGQDKTPPAFLDWARFAIKRGALDDAAEHFERALATNPRDAHVLTEFGEFLSTRKKDDRAAQLLALAASEIEHQKTVDAKLLERVEKNLRKVDPGYQRLADVRAALVKDARAVIERYLAEDLNLVAMDLANHLGGELDEPSLYDGYEKAVRKKGRSLAHWRLVYNEENLEGWNAGAVDAKFTPNGETLDSKFGTYDAKKHDYSILTLDEITSGDYSLEAEVETQKERVDFAGLVFGRKGATQCHALVLFPPAVDKNGSVNLVTFFGADASQTWRTSPVQLVQPAAAASPERTVTKESSRAFFRLRLDVTGRLVDVWVNGEYMATQEFPSLDVLRGSFGLITGRGESRFRNVRFLSRHPRDPSAAIERNMTLEAEQAGGEAINGSWLGLAPPFPSAQKWLQGERKSW
ncbi:MAG: DUF1570 domain-containing protein, partial [Planctomycetes bacterium]|nr:DUF1570 domain-containing protein [Planctomycetota bacterium]